MMPVSPELAHEIFWIEAWHIAALILNVGGNALLHRYADKTPLLRAYLWLQGALLLWIVSKMLKTVSPRVEMRWFFIVTQYLAVCFIGPLFLSFAVRFRYDRAPSLPLMRALYLVSAAFFGLFATNPLHGLFYSYFDFWRDRFGPIFPWFTGYTYSLIGVSVAFCLMRIRKIRSMAVGLLIATAALIPLVINILYTSRVIRPLFDVTPIAMTTSIFFFALAALRFNFLGPIPVARSIVLETLDDLVVFTDGAGRVVHARGAPRGFVIGSTALSDELTLGDRVYRLHSSRLKGKRGFRCYTDITEIARMQEELARENALLEESLVEITRRNERKLFVLGQDLLQSSRRALHDILGHSLTLVIFLLRRGLSEAARGDAIDERAVLDECAERVREGLAGLDRRLGGQVSQEAVLSLALQGLLAVAPPDAIETELVSAGGERALPPALVAAIRDACREAMTNALRHGKARRLSISLLWGATRLIVNVCDDGRGCDALEEGNGMTLMRDALAASGCDMSWQSEEGAGFQLSIRAPLPRDRGPAYAEAAAPKA